MALVVVTSRAWSTSQYRGVPYPLDTTTELEALTGGVAYAAWPYDPLTIPKPDLPADWTSPVDGFYFIDQDHVSAVNAVQGEELTDSQGRRFGSKSVPRASIPPQTSGDGFDAGSVIVVSGDYSSAHESPSDIRCDGTSSEPVWFISDPADKAIFQRGAEIVGDYFFIDGINWVDGDSLNMSIVLGGGLRAGTYVTLRNCDITGGPNSGGITCGGTNATHVAIYNNNIHDMGTLDEQVGDPDQHGFSSGASNQWIGENTFRRLSGDSTQHGAQESQGINTHRVWIFGNDSAGNRQTAHWCKEAQDVFIIENTTDDNNDTGALNISPYSMGAQYNHGRVWFLRNTIGGSVGSEGGIRIASGTGSERILGNLIQNITGTPTFSISESTALMAINCWDTTDCVIAHNTIVNCNAGISTDAANDWEIKANILGNPTVDNASNMFVAADTNVDVDRNVYDTTSVRWNSSTEATDLDTPQGAGHETNAVETTDLKFVNAAGGNFRLAATSPALNVGEATGAYAEFATLYGSEDFMDIAVDLDGVARPQDGTWNAGCYESDP